MLFALHFPQKHFTMCIAEILKFGVAWIDDDLNMEKNAMVLVRFLSLLQDLKKGKNMSASTTFKLTGGEYHAQNERGMGDTG